MTRNYAVEVLHAALEQGVAVGLFQRPGSELELNAVLASLDNLLTTAMTTHYELVRRNYEARERPVQVTEISEIPFLSNDLLFIDSADHPGREVFGRIARCEFEPHAICFIGTAPEWANTLTSTGHKIYVIPAGFVLTAGQKALKPHQSSIGVQWLEVTVGGTHFELN